MEENKLTTRDQLKAYFETGKYPTEVQFADLIDSLRLKEDVLTKKELAILANNLASIDNVYIVCLVNNVGNLKFSIVISTNDAEDQVLSAGDFKGLLDRRFIIGSAPYTIKVKEIIEGDLKENEYYNLTYQLDQTYTITRLFGNNLKTVSEGFDFGELESVGLPIQLSKVDYGRKINTLHTNVKFVNKTEVPIQYRLQASGWGDRYRTEDTVTDHYDLGDYLYLNYKADLTKIEDTIKCDIYNADNDTLLTTAYLVARENHTSLDGGQVKGMKNIRIECSYSVD